jgi:endonuclease/exonuclease/phosphatase family metal-dependent hydrolase
MELTLLTINTWKCDGDYYNRRAVLKQELMKMDAQVILCQECFRSGDGSVDTLDELSQTMGMAAYAVPARKKMRLLGEEWIDSYSGLGVLTALPVTDQTVIDLPSNAGDGGRKAQLLTIRLASGQTLRVANIHLTHLPDDELRRRQLQAVLAVMQEEDASFRIIGGDWNTGHNSPILTHLMETAPAADCYVLGKGTQPVEVDHFFALPPYPSFIRAGVVLDKPDAGSGLYPSDHFGIRVTLSF